MAKVRIEAFLSVPACSAGIALSRLLEEIKNEFGEKIELQVYKGSQPRLEELRITATPALVIGDLVRIIGVCPDRETVIAALRECGVL